MNQFFFCCKPGQKKRIPGSRFFSFFLSSFLPPSPPLVPGYNQLTTYCSLPGWDGCVVSVQIVTAQQIERQPMRMATVGHKIQFNFTRDDSSNKKRSKFNIYYFPRGIFLLLLLSLLHFTVFVAVVSCQSNAPFLPPPPPTYFSPFSWLCNNRVRELN